MFQIKKVFITFLFIYFFIFIPKISAKYIFEGELEFQFEILLPDTQFDSIAISDADISDAGATFTVYAQDRQSGIQRIEIYINGELKQCMEYDETVKEIEEIITIPINDIPLYAECYAIGIDNSENILQSNSIIPHCIRIYDLEDLLYFKELQNSQRMDFEGKDIYLMNDIDLQSISNWEPISSEGTSFKGIFHGNHHTISHLSIDDTYDTMGFFAQNDGIIKDLKVEGTIQANNCKNIGGIVGKNHGIIENSDARVTINGNGENVGGIAGISENGQIRYCINYCPISAEIRSGGICGYSRYTMIECCGNEGVIESSSGYAGGICGYTQYSVENAEFTVGKCYNYGLIKSTLATGGIVGGAWNTEGEPIIIKDCYNTGKINCKNKMNGGILGATYNIYDSSNQDIYKNVITACYNLGELTATFPNQISPKNANVSVSYFLNRASDFSGYGTGKPESSFQSTANNSVYYFMQQVSSDCWCVNQNNNGKLSLIWQEEKNNESNF